MKHWIALLALSALALAEAPQPEWREIPPADGQTTWFVAFEEASFIRKELGDWLPIVFLETPPDQPLRWMLVSATRKANRCSLVLRLTAGTDHVIERSFDWFEKGPDGDLSPVLAEADGEISLAFAENDGGTRRLLIRRASGIPALRESVTISRAQVFWDWAGVEPVQLLPGKLPTSGTWRL